MGSPLQSATPLGPRGFSLRPQTPTPNPGFSPWAIPFLCATSLLATTASAQAQTSPCGLTSMSETARPAYPPIAQIARISGTAILMVRFTPTGEVDHITEISGPPMLLKAATSSVKTWQANAFTGPRECPIVVNFELSHGVDSCDIPPEPAVPYERLDPQHVILRGRVQPICDPGADLHHKHPFLIF